MIIKRNLECRMTFFGGTGTGYFGRKAIRSLRYLFGVGFAVMTSVAVSQGQPNDFPHVVKLIAPFAPGGSDVMARAIGKELGERLGVPVVVENRPGSGGMIGAAAAAKAAKDGSVLLFHSTSLVSGAATRKNLPIDVLNDLVPLAIVSEGPMVAAVSSKSGFKSAKDFVSAARHDPGKLSYGSPGVGSIGHLGVELFTKVADIDLQHVPYQGSGPSLIDIAAGRIDFIMGLYSILAPQVDSGRVVPIGLTSAKSNPRFPNLTPLAETAPGYEANIWYAVFAPKGTPVHILERLNKELNEVAKSKSVQLIVAPDGGAPVPGTLEDASRYVRKEFQTWKRLADERNIVID